MTIIVFIAGIIVGIGATIMVLFSASIKLNARRRVLYEKARGLYHKAGQLFETAQIWHVIGNKDDATKALDEAQRLAQEAQKFEDEADGKKTA